MKIALACAAAALSLSCYDAAFGQGSSPNPYPTMPPLSQYLMSSDKEIALARSAAPASISSKATIMVLTLHGFSVSVKGENGFTCFVGRALGRPDSWNLKVQDPTCYNAAASRTVMQYDLKRTNLALTGMPLDQIDKTIDDAVAAKTMPLAAPDSIAYMMSKEQYISDAAKSWFPHVMLFMPEANNANLGISWGADREGSPVAFAPDYAKLHDPWARFFIPVTRWSDGSVAPPYDGT